MDSDKAAKQNWAICIVWNVTDRYNSARVEAEKANTFVEAAAQFYYWIQQRS